MNPAFQKILDEYETITTQLSSGESFDIAKLGKRQSELLPTVEKIQHLHKLEVEQEETTFWDDPEGNFKKIAEQLRIANLRIDEQAYASDKPDYWKVVNGESIQEAFKDDVSFMNDFQRSNKPYELAYEYLKAKTETKVQTETRTREQMKEELRKELLKELGLKNDKEVPPSINNIGSNNSTRKNVIEDGFAAVFGLN
jgi:adenylate cyclase class IV